MNWGQLGRLAHLARDTPRVLRRPVTLEAARDRLRRQLEHRDQTFLESARLLIHDNPRSPYRRLLEWAGWAPADLETGVRHHGLEATLTELRVAGVRLSLDEFKLRSPIARKGLEFQPEETDFDSPAVGGGFSGATSGTRGAATRVMYDWEFIEEEAAHEVVLAAVHDISSAPTALWYPALPSVAGVHNLLIALVAGRPPARWFSQIDPAGATFLHRATVAGIQVTARLAGLRAPRPERAGTDSGGVDRVLDWIDSVRRTGRTAVVKTFGSSAVRLAQRAIEKGHDPAGAILFSGGEPLTDLRREYIESAGFRAFPRYVATESGLIGAGCPSRESGDDMHLYTDRLAVIPGEDGGAASAGEGTPLLFTSLTLHTGKVLLNTELGDVGRLRRRPCSCEFGRLGFDLHVSDVASRERLMLEGMTVPRASFEAVIASIIGRSGGSPDAFQYWKEPRDGGLERLVIAVSPGVAIDQPRFVEEVCRRMEQSGPGLELAGRVWREAGTLRLVREEPRPTAGAKLLSFAGSARTGPTAGPAG